MENEKLNTNQMERATPLLLPFLQEAEKLEEDLYGQNQILEILERQIKPLGQPGKIEAINRATMPNDIVLAPEEKRASTFACNAGWVICIGMIVADFFLRMIPALLLFAVAMISWGLNKFFKGQEIKQKKQRLMWEVEQKNKEEQRRWDEATKKEKERMDNELAVKEALELQRQTVLQQTFRTREALKKLYSLGLVHPKYQGLIPIATLLEYIETGRCQRLVGSDGGYNLYEQELRMDRIITRLDSINKKLDMIRQNQVYLYQAAQDTNQMISGIEASNCQMIDSIASLNGRMITIQENAELAAFNAKSTADTAQAMLKLEEWREWKSDDSYFTKLV